MTKIGEGRTPPEEPSPEMYHRQLDRSSLKFLRTLEKYQNSSGEEKERLKSIMDQQLKIIQSAVNELKRAGISKQEVKFENVYRAYLDDESPSNFAALEHDLFTLREYNELP